MPSFEAGEIVRPTRSALGDVDVIGVVTGVVPHASGIESLDEYRIRIGREHQLEFLAFELEKATARRRAS